MIAVPEMLTGAVNDDDGGVPTSHMPFFNLHEEQRISDMEKTHKEIDERKLCYAKMMTDAVDDVAGGVRLSDWRNSLFIPQRQQGISGVTEKIINKETNQRKKVPV